MKGRVKMAQRKQYSKDFKDMIVELYNSGKSSTEICQEYGIGQASLNRWVNERKDICVDSQTTLSLQEIKQIQRENARLRQEIDILKKAMTIFVTK